MENVQAYMTKHTAMCIGLKNKIQEERMIRSHKSQSSGRTLPASSLCPVEPICR